MSLFERISRVLQPGIGLKRWIVILTIGIVLLGAGIAFAALDLQALISGMPLPFSGWLTLALLAGGGLITAWSIIGYSQTILAPYRTNQRDSVLNTVYAYSRRQKGMRIVAIGGGTGLPSTLRAMKAHTSNITAIVTVADDGGSSGRLRRDLGVLPPGDLRNNIAALADDESLMTQLFQHRFSRGELGGHAFGNLFISALASVTGSLETALIETGRVLNIQGQVFPATLEDIELVADVAVRGRRQTIQGESRITGAEGRILDVRLEPPAPTAFEGSVSAILNAEMVVLGPGSLYTSILPNLLVPGIAEALRNTLAVKCYVCNIATQPGETEGYTVADHVLAIEKILGRGVIQIVLANNHYPTQNAGQNTFYVQPVPESHEIFQRYTVWYTDLVDAERPWRHDPQKLADAIAQRDIVEKQVLQASVV